MDPANPPLPSPRYLPFHPESGSHTSILISESLAGFRVAATRQNAGRFLVAAAGMPKADGGTNAPASTGCASVMVVSSSFSAARLSQVAARAECAPAISRNKARGTWVLVRRLVLTAFHLKFERTQNPNAKAGEKKVSSAFDNGTMLAISQSEGRCCWRKPVCFAHPTACDSSGT